jgi:hypothetical protein
MRSKGGKKCWRKGIGSARWGRVGGERERKEGKVGSWAAGGVLGRMKGWAGGGKQASGLKGRGERE